MNNYIKEITELSHMPLNEIVKDFKIIFVGGKILHITNYQKILEYSLESIKLRINKDILNIHGLDMLIVQINKSELIIKGRIFSIFMGDENVNKK